MTQETSATIAAWGEAAFGPVSDLSVLAARAREELAELEAAIAAGDCAEIAREAADVAILLHRLAALSGRDLNEAVNEKMAVNRARVWRRSGDGVGRHI